MRQRILIPIVAIIRILVVFFYFRMEQSSTPTAMIAEEGYQAP